MGPEAGSGADGWDGEARGTEAEERAQDGVPKVRTRSELSASRQGGPDPGKVSSHASQEEPPAGQSDIDKRRARPRIEGIHVKKPAGDRGIPQTISGWQPAGQGTPLQPAMSMLNFYINRAGENLSAARKRILSAAKPEWRRRYGR